MATSDENGHACIRERLRPVEVGACVSQSGGRLCVLGHLVHHALQEPRGILRLWGGGGVDEVRKGLISAPKELKVSRLVACLFAETNDRGLLARPREEERGRRTEGCLTFLLHLWTEWDLVEKCLLSKFNPNLEALRWRRTLLRTALRVARHAARGIFAL